MLAALAEQVAALPGYQPDLPPGEIVRLLGDAEARAEREVRELLGDGGIVGYHATRLLPHEAHWIRTRGMGPLTRELIERRLRGAVDHYPDQINKAEADPLRGRTAVHTLRYAKRFGLLHLFSPLEVLDHERSLDYFLEEWGGEALGDAARGDESDANASRKVLRSLDALSTPTVVAIATAPSQLQRWGSVTEALLPHALGCTQIRGGWVLEDIHLGPGQIVDFIQPGHPRWNPIWLKPRPT